MFVGAVQIVPQTRNVLADISFNTVSTYTGLSCAPPYHSWYPRQVQYRTRQQVKTLESPTTALLSYKRMEVNLPEWLASGGEEEGVFTGFTLDEVHTHSALEGSTDSYVVELWEDVYGDSEEDWEEEEFHGFSLASMYVPMVLFPLHGASHV